MQKQIDLLNQEAREAEVAYKTQLQSTLDQIEQLKKDPQKDLARVKTLENENIKLRRDAKWLRTQRDALRQSLSIQQIGGQTYELPFAFSLVPQVVEEALTQNGYSILSSMQTDQKAIFITDRKTSLPPSLELSGFRNQYLATIEKASDKQSLLWVRAEFEKISKEGHIFPAPQSELTDIELRLIQEIHQGLSGKF